ncbi:MAG: hypothetical protein M1819_004513 [Sarea resinae]|nr:MAG: hypothetical protein M1819_004513 [Sarea resinae]
MEHKHGDLARFPSQQVPHLPPHPLINLVTNEWKNESEYELPSSPVEDRPWLRMIKTKRYGRYIVFCLWLTAIAYVAYDWWLSPRWAEQKIFRDSFDQEAMSSKGWYGTNVRPAFTNMVQLKTLDSHLIPQSGRSMDDKRLVIVGDVHGCKDELLKLLDKVSFKPVKDHLILTGDMIAKGPDSSGVIDLARELGASCVRGNHEDRVLLAHHDVHSKHLPLQGPEEDPQTGNDDLGEESFSHGDYRDRALARRLNDQQVNWLKECPVILKVGDVDGMGEVVVVHAGLVPGLDLNRQDPFNVMNMRSVDLETHVPSETRSGMPWEKLWNYFQSSVPKVKRSTVIYGHDSKRGLTIQQYSKGLDSGCVNGNELTALVIEGGRFSAMQKLVKVKCKGRHSAAVDKQDVKEMLPNGQH